MAVLSSTVDKQKALRRDCICNIENTDQEKGVSGGLLTFTIMHLTHIDDPAGLAYVKR